MRKPFFEIRSSSIQGSGAFAIRRIRGGTRIIEYTGERITQAKANARYGDDSSEYPHVLLFTLDRRTIIDGGVGGNEARFINHSCEPNCQTVVEKKRLYVEALRTIQEREELTFDYHLDCGAEVSPEDEMRYACRCGTATCRGTMLAPPSMEKQRSGRKAERKQGTG